MDGQGQDGHTKAKGRGNEGFANTAGNGHSLAGFNIEDTKGTDHAADSAQEAQEGRHSDDDAEKI